MNFNRWTLAITAVPTTRTSRFPTTGYARVLQFIFIRRDLGGTGTGCLFQFSYCGNGNLLKIWRFASFLYVTTGARELNGWLGPIIQSVKCECPRLDIARSRENARPVIERSLVRDSSESWFETHRSLRVFHNTVLGMFLL